MVVNQTFYTQNYILEFQNKLRKIYSLYPTEPLKAIVEALEWLVLKKSRLRAKG